MTSEFIAILCFAASGAIEAFTHGDYLLGALDLVGTAVACVGCAASIWENA